MAHSNKVSGECWNFQDRGVPHSKGSCFFKETRGKVVVVGMSLAFAAYSRVADDVYLLLADINIATS